jgi:hypothetical protein
MIEEFWPDLGKAFAAGLLAGGAFVAMQWVALAEIWCLYGAGTTANVSCRPGT